MGITFFKTGGVNAANGGVCFHAGPIYTAGSSVGRFSVLRRPPFYVPRLVTVTTTRTIESKNGLVLV